MVHPILDPSKTILTLSLSITAPQTCLNPDIQNCEYNCLHSKRAFTDVIKLETLKWGGRLSWWTQGKEKGPNKGKREAGESEMGWRVEAEIGVIELLAGRG